MSGQNQTKAWEFVCEMGLSIFKEFWLRGVYLCLCLVQLPTKDQLAEARKLHTSGSTPLIQNNAPRNPNAILV
jgi:hypothetical protein